MSEDDYDFNGISKEKANLISEIIRQSKNIPEDNIIPFFLNAAMQANSHGITFSDHETDIIINSLKTNMTPAQQTRMDTVRNLANAISAGKIK